MSWDDEDTTFEVVINHEEQYSIWPDYKEIPPGWANRVASRNAWRTSMKSGPTCARSVCASRWRQTQPPRGKQRGGRRS